MQIKLVFTRKVVHLAWFWKGGFWNSKAAYCFGPILLVGELKRLKANTNSCKLLLTQKNDSFADVLKNFCLEHKKPIGDLIIMWTLHISACIKWLKSSRTIRVQLIIASTKINSPKWRQNSNGPKHDPWGTPWFNCRDSEHLPLSETRWERPDRYDTNHSSAVPRIPKLVLRRDSNTECSTVSKAALRSNNTSRTTYPFKLGYFKIRPLAERRL